MAGLIRLSKAGGVSVAVGGEDPVVDTRVWKNDGLEGGALREADACSNSFKFFQILSSSSRARTNEVGRESSRREALASRASKRRNNGASLSAGGGGPLDFTDPPDLEEC